MKMKNSYNEKIFKTKIYKNPKCRRCFGLKYTLREEWNICHSCSSRVKRFRLYETIDEIETKEQKVKKLQKNNNHKKKLNVLKGTRKKHNIVEMLGYRTIKSQTKIKGQEDSGI